ncbi:MAG: flagellar hook assembly protein FlgD [Gammaproteobacteria bacterium]|nr:flagellar hook assembly protein FlgD [Gammaproteobacteria bacterium]
MSNISQSTQTSLQQLGLTAQPQSTKKREELGQADFLKLMVTQLQSQDPFSPMENGEFISQMAQFSSVTGLSDLKQSFDKLATSLQSNQALQASSLVGRTVMVPSDTGILPTSGGMAGSIDLPSSSSGVTLTVKDSVGQTIRRLELGPQAAGDVYFRWDGLTDAGISATPGRYFISAEASLDGKTVALETLTSASVDSVTLGRGGQGLTLNLTDGNTVDFASVREIK